MSSKIEITGPEKAPANGKKPKKVIVFLHGLGANGNDLFSLVPYFAEVFPDAYFYSPDAPFECDMAPVGRQWFSLKNREESTILEGVRNVEPHLNKFLDGLLKQHGLNPEDLILIGFSQGTMLALHTALRRKDPLGAVLGYSGALVGGDVLKDEIKSRPEICLIHGEADEVVPFIAFQEAMNSLRENGVLVHGYSREELGHGIDPAGIKMGSEFIKHALEQAAI